MFQRMAYIPNYIYFLILQTNSRKNRYLAANYTILISKYLRKTRQKTIYTFHNHM